MTNDSGTSEEVVLDIAYADGATAVVAGKTFVTPNSAVTISLNSAYASDYDLVSFDGNMAADNSVTYKFGKDFTADFVQKSATVQEHIPVYVSFYSEVPVEYLYNGENVVETLTGSDNIYLIPDYAVNGTLPAIATSEDNHYFLGWANKDATGNYQFVASATVDAFYEEGASELTTPVYYAIWAESSRAINTDSYSVTDGATVPATPTATDGTTFYRWYADKDFTQLLNGTMTSTTVYARWQFTLDFLIDGGGDTRFYFNGGSGFYTRKDVDTVNDSDILSALGGEIVVYEGGYVSVMPSNSYKQINIALYYGKTDSKAYRTITITGVGKGSWWQWNKDRPFFGPSNADKYSTIGAGFIANTDSNGTPYTNVTVPDNTIWIYADNIMGNIRFELQY